MLCNTCCPSIKNSLLQVYQVQEVSLYYYFALLALTASWPHPVTTAPLPSEASPECDQLCSYPQPLLTWAFTWIATVIAADNNTTANAIASTVNFGMFLVLPFDALFFVFISFNFFNNCF